MGYEESQAAAIRVVIEILQDAYLRYKLELKKHA